MFGSTNDRNQSYGRQSHIYDPADPRLAELGGAKHIVKSIHVDISHDHRDPDDELELMRASHWSGAPTVGNSVTSIGKERL